MTNMARNKTEQTTEQKKQTSRRENSKGEPRRMELEVVDAGRWSWKK
jgi:hypothetical protein